MQPRILVQQDGNKKKRFISPTQIKNNQLVYGDAVGSSKFINIPHTNVPISQRVYSPNSGSQRSIVQIEKEHIQGKVKIGQIRKNTQSSILNDSKQSSEMSKQSSTKRPSRQQNSHQSSRSKSGKKDYMMAHLSKLNSNNKKSSINHETQSNSSQSRSKIGSIRSIDKNKNSLRNQRQQEYKMQNKNVYNRKQPNLNQKDRISGSTEQYRKRFTKKPEQLKISHSGDEVKIIVRKPSVHVSQVKPEQQIKSFYQQEKRSPRWNMQKPPAQKHSQIVNEEIQKFMKSPSSNANPNYQLNHPSKNQDSQSSTLAVHLKKAHEQKEELRQKKIQAQRQRNEYKQRSDFQQQQIANLRKQIQNFQVQNLSLTSELKSIRQASNFTKSQLHETNTRNQHLYRQLHQKYTSVMKEYKKAILSNEQLKKQLEDQNLQNLNLLKRNEFNEQRIRQLQQNFHIQQNQHLQMIEKNTIQWMEKYQKTERQLRKFKQKQLSGGMDQPTRNKFLQVQKDFQIQKDFVTQKNQQINKLKKQFQLKFTTLQKVLQQKDKQIAHLNAELKKQQTNFTEKIFQLQKNIKDLQLKIAHKQKQLEHKKIELSQIQSKGNQSTLRSQIDQLYSTNRGSSQTFEAKSTVEHIVSSQTQELNYYKKSLNEKIDENFNLRSEVQQLRSQNNNTRQELQIMKLQYSSLAKKQEQSSSTQIYMIKSQSDAALRRQKQLQQKLEMKINEVKEKQQFIQSFLMGQNK